jgi:hypothetical protein
MRASFSGTDPTIYGCLAFGFALGLASATVAGCGGSLSSSDASDARSGDAGSRDDSSANDAGSRDASPEAGGDAAGCIATPVTGAACTPGVAACSPGDLCCTGEWTCDATSHTWTLERGGCACLVDAGSGQTLPDGGISVASCASCTSSEICVVTVASGGPCLMPNDAGGCPNGSTASPGQCCDDSSTSYRCDSRPPACGQELSCGCAMSLCQSCLCQGTTPSGNTLNCACEYP